MYRFNGFTQKANHAMNLAIQCAEEMGHTYVGSEHILLGLLKEGSGVAAAVLRAGGQEVLPSGVGGIPYGAHLGRAPAVGLGTRRCRGE